MVMDEIQTVKKFQAKIPIAIWRKWEEWLDDRGSLNNTQIMVGLLRLFLACPEDIQLKALFGREQDLGGLKRAEDELLSKRAEAEQIVAEAERNAQAQRQKPGHPGRKVAG